MRIKKEANKILEGFQKSDREAKDYLGGAIESGDKERIARAQLGLIEQRMMYIIANANKKADRITVKDIENAAELTKILDLTKRPETIIANYTRIKNELDGKFRRTVKTYVRHGGRKDFILDYYNYVPTIQRYKKRQLRLQEEQQIQEDTNYLDNVIGL